MSGDVPAAVFDEQRLLAVQATGLLDTRPEEAFDRLARLASMVLRTPFAFVTVVDDTRSYWKSCVGVASGARQNAVEESFCQYVIGSGTRLIVGDTAADPRTRHNPSIAAMGVAAWAGFPLLGPGGEILGTFCVVDTETRSWSEEDIAVLDTLSQAAAGEIALREALERAERHAADLVGVLERATALARTLQESLLPPLLPAMRGAEVAARYLPAGTGDVLGDFYDVFQTDETAWGILLGDVSGKGVPAAKVAALARHTVRTAAMYLTSPADNLAVLNAALIAQHPHGEEGFLTVVYATLRHKDDGADLTLSSAGHTPALVRRADGAVRRVGVHGLPLGLFDEPELVDETVALHQGDLLVLYSDGVTEARSGREQFGEERLVALIEALPVDAGAATVVDRVEHAVAAFAPGARSDDVAILALRITAP